MTTAMLHGEPLSLLLEAIAQMKFVHESDGSLRVDVRLERRLGDPFVRALERVEAQLLLDEADRPEGLRDHSPDEERAAKAFTVVVVNALNAA